MPATAATTTDLQAPSSPLPSTEVEQVIQSASNSIVPSENTVSVSAGEAIPPSRPVQKSIAKCFMCRAKIPLAKQTINKCRCGYVHCDIHKVPDKHDCDFDFAKMGKDILTKNNPKLNEVHKGGRSFNRIDWKWLVKPSLSVPTNQWILHAIQYYLWPEMVGSFLGFIICKMIFESINAFVCRQNQFFCLRKISFMDYYQYCFFE